MNGRVASAQARRVRVPMLALCLAVISVALVGAELPRSLDPELQIERLAGAPELVTPVGCTVDATGRIFVLESHTHFPPQDYSGPASDRIRVVVPGAPGPPRVAAEGIRWGMHLAMGPEGTLYVTHRNGVLRYRLEGDPVRAVDRAAILTMETRGDYPHNGIGGIAFGPDGWLYLGTGENLGLPYAIFGSDQRRVAVRAGAGGVVVRCRADGSGLEGFARGFWNAFGMTFDRHERLFVVDNDPDSRPPCRLLDVIRGGNYGFQFRHGRDGLSPLIAWDGELPGTLGMVAGTGEAPSSILDAAATRFPARYDGALFVAATWDHRIEVFRPVPVGATLRSDREPLVVGGATFRPVSLAAAPDGSLVFTDWVKSDYPVHGAGALWRLSARTPSATPPRSLPPLSEPERVRRSLEQADPVRARESLVQALGDSDPFVRATAIHRLSPLPEARLDATWAGGSPRERTGLLLAARGSLEQAGPTGHRRDREKAWIGRGLRDADPEVRTAALVWAIEEELGDVGAGAPEVLQVAGLTPLLVELHAVAVERFQAMSHAAETAAVTDAVVQVWAIPNRPSPEQIARSVARIRARQTPLFLRVNAVMDLAGTDDPDAVNALQALARNTAEPAQLRAEAILSLTGTHHDHVTALKELLDDLEEVVAVEVARALAGWLQVPGVRPALQAAATSGRDRVAALASVALGTPPAHPEDVEGWIRLLDAAPGDPERGSRVFRSATVACARCHRVQGRGGLLGPDLSTIRRGSDREKLLWSLLEPSRDIAPQFAEHRVETVGGEQYSGRLVSQDPDGTLVLMGGDGGRTRIPGRLVAAHLPGSLSLMPEGLMASLTVDEVRDLMAYLENLR